MNGRPLRVLRWCAGGALAVLFAIFPARLAADPQPPPPDPLLHEFLSPPPSARPRTWWHWTGGNVTPAGITKDLEWMKRVGIAGFQLADVTAGSGQSVEPKVTWGSPQWLDDVRLAASEADRLGLEMSLFSSAGWSETGGPWVKPQQAMKKLVWSETTVAGPAAINQTLLQPPSNNGPFGNLLGGSRGDATFYGDSAVVAFRTPADDVPMADLSPQISASSANFDGTALMDGNLNTTASIAAPADGPAWVQYEFPRPITARAITLVAPGRGIPFGRILASDDGSNFRPLVDLPGPTQYRAGVIRTYALPTPTTARLFRVEMTAAALDPGGVMNQTPPQPARRYTLSEFTIHTGARVNRWQEKAGFNFLYEYQTTFTPPVPAASCISTADVIDLTSRMDADGALHWDAPPGRWTVLRMGYSLTGSKNRPAPEAGLGFEVDKLNRKDVEAYFAGYTAPIFNKLGPLVGKSLRYMTMDSFEGGMQNWTDDMLDQFQRRRGYDPRPYLPVLTGRVVGSASISDRFLWDFRRTIADLLAEAHYGTMSRQAAQHGLGIYAEANGVSMEFMEDTLLDKSMVQIPMGEFWVHALHPPIQYYVDNRGAASAAHAYGKRLVGAESFTGGGYESPFTLKRIADYWFTQGVNRIVFHTSAHQPLDTKPGNTMVGTPINRNITWAEQATPFITYLSRCMALLQRGLFVADLAYLLPEGAPSSQSFWGAGLQPTPPPGYDYDCINADVLLHRISVGPDGRLILPGGMSYRALILPQTQQMTLPVLNKIRQLLAGGATIIGPRPTQSPSLADGTDADVAALASDVWGDLDGVMRNERYVGKGHVFWGLPLVDVLASLGIASDVETTHNLDAPVSWIHRRDGDADIYFLASGSDNPQTIEARFRVSGKQPELWHPDTGAMHLADYTTADGRTTVPLQLAPRESIFVIFRHSTTSPARRTPAPSTTTLATIDGPWSLSFPPGLGAPAQLQMNHLIAWTASNDPGVQFFSGTATYATAINIQPQWLHAGQHVLLDLGRVRDLAEVSLNGKPLGVLWKPPFRVDMSEALQPGENQLQVKVTNEWSNRILGDSLLPADKRVFPAASAPRGMRGAGNRTVAIPAAGRGGGDLIAPVPPNDERPTGVPGLEESGLIGPVTLISQQTP